MHSELISSSELLEVVLVFILCWRETKLMR